MGLNWPGVFMGVNGLPEPEKKIRQAVVDEFGDTSKAELSSCGLPPHASPSSRQFSLIAVPDNSQILVGISPSTGMPQMSWLDGPNGRHPLSAMVDLLQNQQGWTVAAVGSLPLPGSPQRSTIAQRVEAEHAREMETMNTLGKLGDISHVRHRAQSALARGQRSQSRRPGARRDRGHPRRTRPGHREARDAPGCPPRRVGAARLDAQLGRLRGRGHRRDPPIRHRQRPDPAAAAGALRHTRRQCELQQRAALLERSAALHRGLKRW